MPDHLIRLRRGWEPSGPTTSPPTSLFALPCAGFPGGPGGLTRIVRWFRSPAIDPARETLWLRLDAVPGLNSVSLNGVEIARGPFGDRPVTVPLGPDLPARNHLTLDLGPLPDGEALTREFAWGDVALVVRRADPD